MNTRFFQCGLVALALTMTASVFGTETASRATTSDNPNNASLVEKRPEPSAQTTVTKSLFRPASVIHPMFVGAGAALCGFVFTLLYLLKKLSRYWGLQILKNKWSIGFLLTGTGFSVLSSPVIVKLLGTYAGASFESLESFANIGTSLGASVLGSGFVSGVQKMFGRPSSTRAQSSTDDGSLQPKGFFFDRIIESLESQINEEMFRLAMEFDWTAIIEIARKVIIPGQVTARVTRQEGDEVVKEIEELRKKDTGKKKDNLDKYEALNLILRCVSFETLLRECRRRRQTAP